MFKKFKKKSIKSKIFIIACIVIIAGLLAYVLYSNFKPAPPAEYEIAAVSYGSVEDNLDVSGTVESGLSENFTAIDGVFVEEVLVSVGDRVEPGTKLATFNVSGTAGALADAKKQYDDAFADYNNAKSSTDATAAKKRELADKIAKKTAEINTLKNEIAALEKEIAETEPVTEYISIPEEQIKIIAAQMAQNGATAEQIEQFITAASQAKIPVTSTDTKKAEELMQKNLTLAQLNSELAALQAENAVTVSADNETMLKALKTVADTKKTSYENLKKVYDAMAGGWYAKTSGIVTVVNIKPGEKFVHIEEEQSSDISSLLGMSGVDSDTAALISSLLGENNSSALGTGITVESYDDLFVNVTVGKSDLLKIKTGMKAVITSVGKEYEGEVVYVGATATENSGLDLGSITDSIMGGSGAGGAVVKIKIKKPDENIVIGFDVDIKINIATIDNVLKVPVETVLYTSGEYYVFVFDGKTVTKRKIERGILDDTSYQIIDGLKEGEKVVKTPDPNFEDGTKIKEKTA